MKDYINQKFGMITVLSLKGFKLYGKNKKKFNIYECICECGNKTDCLLSELKSGHKKSCGCYGKSRLGNLNRTHGKSQSRIYKIWKSIRRRSLGLVEPKDKNYYHENLGMDEKWFSDFSEFESWALSNGYNESLTIDRIDGTKGYYPENCRWTTMLEQSRNRKNVIKYELEGKFLTLKEVSYITGIKYMTLRARMFIQGLSFDEAISR